MNKLINRSSARQMSGTRFVACDACDASDAWVKERVRVREREGPLYCQHSPLIPKFLSRRKTVRRVNPDASGGIHPESTSLCVKAYQIKIYIYKYNNTMRGYAAK